MADVEFRVWHAAKNGWGDQAESFRHIASLLGCTLQSVEPRHGLIADEPGVEFVFKFPALAQPNDEYESERSRWMGRKVFELMEGLKDG